MTVRVMRGAASTTHALGVAAVIGVAGATADLRDGDNVLVDGDGGLLIVHPEGCDITAGEHRRRSVRERPRRRFAEARS